MCQTDAGTLDTLAHDREVLMIGPIIAAGGSLAGSLWGNRQKRQEAQKDRDFQERMSSTSWVRGKADMEAAGINPALAYARGGASTPGGAMAQQEDVARGAVSSGLQAKRLKAELKLLDQQEKHTRMGVVKERELANVAKTQSHRTIQLELNDAVQNKILNLQLPWMKHSAAAINKFPQAAMMQLILNSGGSQAIGMAGGLGLARALPKIGLRRGKR